MSSNYKIQRWVFDQQIPLLIIGSKHKGIPVASIDINYLAICRHAVGVFGGMGNG